jgi:hypothetical protein
MSDVKLTARLTNMLTDTGATALLTIINATRTISTGGRPVNGWFIGWKTGEVFTSDQFQAGTDAERLPEIISVCVSATIPAHMILAQQSREHQDLRLHEGEVWSVEDLACHDLRTFQLLEFSSSMDTCHWVWDRMRAECPERFREFAAARNPSFE